MNNPLFSHEALVEHHVKTAQLVSQKGSTAMLQSHKTKMTERVRKTKTEMRL